MQLESRLTCPKCGFQATEQMPLDACQFFYECKGCGEKLKPKAGDCCVFCSYGSVPCPPVQQDGGQQMLRLTPRSMHRCEESGEAEAGQPRPDRLLADAEIP